MDHQPQAPLTTAIRAVRSRAERIRQQELARQSGQLRGLDPCQQAQEPASKPQDPDHDRRQA